MKGDLPPTKAVAARDKKVQANAGGGDRLASDEGGHLVAHRFNGPNEAYNLFAQDRNFNRSGYARLENELDKARKAGKSVKLDIAVAYEGSSKRPSELRMNYYINGVRHFQTFANRSGKAK